MPELHRTPTPEVTHQLVQLGDRLDRVAHRNFLEATMAASALVAMADGVLHPAERDMLGTLRERVDGLPAFDTETAAEYYREYLDALAADSRSGRERVFAAVGRIAGDDGAAPLVIQVCLTIAIADRSVGQSEYDAICELSNKLGLNLRDLEV